MRQIAVVFIVSVLSVLVRAEDPMSASELKTFADGLYARGLYGMALEEYQKFIKAYPDHEESAVVLVRSGEAARKLGEPERSVAFFRQAVALGVNNQSVQRAQLRLVEHDLRQGDAVSAATQAQELIEGNPEKELASAAWYYLAQARGALKDGRGRNAALSTLIQRFPGDPFATYAALQLGRDAQQPIGERERYYQLVLENPSSADMEAEARWGLASLSMERGDFGQAAREFRALRERMPDASRVSNGMLHMAWVSFQAKEYEETLELLETLKRPQPNAQEALCLYLEGSCSRALGLEADATRFYERLMKAEAESPYAVPAAYDLAVIYHEAGAHEKLLVHEDILLQHKEQRESALWMLAEAYRELGRREKAQGLYDDLAKEFPLGQHTADAAYNHAVLLQKEGKAAPSVLVDFARQFPDDARACKALVAAGALLVKAGESEEAIVVWTEVLERYPEHEQAEATEYRLGLLQMRVQKDQEALTTLGHYLERKPQARNAADAAFWAGVIQSDAGKTEEAVAMFQRVLNLRPSKSLAAKTQIRLGMLLQEQENAEEALDAFTALCRSGDEGLLPDAQLVWMMRQARFEGDNEALLLVGKAMSREGREALTQELGAFTAAEVLREQKKPEEALALLLPALQNASKSEDAAEAALAAGDMLLAASRDEDALRVYRQAASIGASVDRSELQAKGWKGMARVHERKQDWEEAARLFMGVAVLYDDAILSAECLARAANAFTEAGDGKAAAQAREELKQRYPDSEWNRAQVLP